MKLEQSLRQGQAEGEFGNSHAKNQGHEVVTLTFVCAELPTKSISEQLARELRREAGAPVVLVRLKGGNGLYHGAGFRDSATVVDWAPAELVLEGQFGLPCSLF